MDINIISCTMPLNSLYSRKEERPIIGNKQAIFDLFVYFMAMEVGKQFFLLMDVTLFYNISIKNYVG